MNRDRYKLGSKDILLDLEAEGLMEDITFLANERNYHNRFPMFSTIDYSDIEETTLIEKIIKLETVYAKAGRVHHKAHPYFLDSDNRIYHNDTEYGDEINNSAPICGGKTPLDALKNAWKKWSIPPVLILNAEYYVPNVGIVEVI